MDPWETFPLCPGRTSPELGAQLFQVEFFLRACPEIVEGYLAVDHHKFHPDPGLCSVADHPELAPYRSLDVSRLKLSGAGIWPMEKYLDGAFCSLRWDPQFPC